MRKLHVLLTKESIDQIRIDHSIVIVIDVLLATTTIAAALHYGAKEVIPVMDADEAKHRAKALDTGTYIISGEKDGYTIEGFIGPSPSEIARADIKGKTLVFCTTNGTVAVRKAENAAGVYTSSLVNGKYVAEQIHRNSDSETVIIVCSGSRGAFNVEDFYGAGHLIHHLLKDEKWELTDAAIAAVRMYEGYAQNHIKALSEARIGKFIAEQGFGDDVIFAAQIDSIPVVPVLQKDKLIVEKRGIIKAI